MKNVILFLFILFTINTFGQDRRGIYFRNKNNNKMIKLCFNDRTEFKIKDNYLKELSDSIQVKHKMSGSLIATLIIASLDTLYFEDSLHIPINQLEWIYTKSNSYYANMIAFTGSMVLLGFLNYDILYNNQSIGSLITCNILIGGSSLIMIPIVIRKNVVYTENWEPIAIAKRNRNTFKPNSKTHTIFDRLELPSPQRK
ncbi:MAG: hypothetical protein V4538_05055 [Bacteroidota bacterium]